jgi:RNA polymerase sigma factor (sigma-70 family)
LIQIVEQTPHKGSSLLEAYRATGSPEAFAQIMRAYGAMVFNVCLKVTKDPADAEDASQATFLTLAVQLKTGATIKYLGPWLKKVAKRSSLDLVRSRKRRSRREAITAENRPDYYRVHPGRRSEESELQQLIREELDQLPAKYRMPLVLHYFGGMNHEQISREMNCTPAALGVRLHRARKMLGKRLSERGINLESAALGAAIAVSVQSTVSEHFIQSTTHAMMSMTAGRPPGMGPLALGSHLPPSLGIVPQLVQEIAQSMARTRMRYATLALAMSITCLGGAAEAVRHLPDSIRPNLEFLAPSKALENLFRWNVPAPRLQEKPTVVDQPKLAQIDRPIPADDPNYPPYAPPVPLMPAAPRSYPPVLAYKTSTPVPPISTHTPHLENALEAPGNVTKDRPITSLARIDTGSSTPVATRNPQQDWGSSTSSSQGWDPAPIPRNNDQPTNPSESRAIKPDPQSAPVTTYVPPPSALHKSSSNLDRTTTIPILSSPTPSSRRAETPTGSQTLSLPSSESFNDGFYTAVAGSCQVDWLTLRPNDIYVHPGDGIYAWSDSANGIRQGGVNSVNFVLNDATGYGVFNIQKLPNNTTLAPARPTGHTFIGIWAIDTLVNYGGIDLQVRYDPVLAQSLGLDEKVLKLWIYDGKEWVRIMDSTFARDLENHMLSGSWSKGKIEYFAVSAPEPGAVFGLVFAGAAALLRRRR